LEYASKDLQNNFFIVLEAVKNNGSSLEFASEKLKNNFEKYVKFIFFLMLIDVT
jgi:hypothetical protein